MHLLYVDESGSSHDPHQIHFVIAGISVFERQCFWTGEQLDKIAERFNPGDPSSVELHASPMFSGRGMWRHFPKEQRIQAIKDCLQVLVTAHSSLRVFAGVVRKSKITPKDPVEFVFEQLASRFDYFLRRLYKGGDNHRGIIIFDKSTYESTIQNLATDFRKIGHSWDILRNLAEVPLFIDSRASRLIQLADIVAYSIFRNYEHRDSQFFEIFAHRLDRFGGTVHGLYENI